MATFALIIALCCLSPALVACANDGDGGNNTHSFIDYVYNNDATCVTDGTETAKCEFCDERDTRVMPNTATGDHNYVDYICSVCKAIDPEKWTQGLEYEEITDNGHIIGYKVSGIGEVTATEIYISAEHNGKAVTSIGMAFYGCDKLETVFYKGTIDEFNKITIEASGNTSFLRATVYCYSETAPQDEGFYWRYDSDGKTPVVWVKDVEITE